MSRAYPVSLIVDGRRCLVVGGGPVAARKVAGLADCGARVDVVADSVHPEISALAAAHPGQVVVQEGRYREGTDLSAYWLVVTATDDSAVNAAVAADADAARVWVNAADDPTACSFTLPSVARRGPISVAVSTEGTSPALAAWLRRRFADELGPEYEELAGLLAEARNEMRAAGRSTERANWQAALDSDMLELIRAGQVGLARERLQACL